MRAPAAPLAPGYREEPLWHAGVPVPAAAAETRPLPTRADVMVVGAGYCGVAAGAELARRGRHVVVLDAEAIGAVPDSSSASTRNGGMVIPELKHGPRWLTRRYGPLGGELVDAVLDAFDLVERVVAERAIDCAYRRTGGLLLAHHEAQVGALRDEAHEWADLGEDARFVPRDELRSEIGTDEYAGGLLRAKTGAIQPAEYHAGLVRVALDAGAELHALTRVVGLERRPGGRFVARTDRGTVEAGDVLVATNAYADSLVPALHCRVMPIGSYIIATEPLEPTLAHDVMPGERMCFDTKNFLFYWRLSPDGRVVFGGRTSLAPTTVARARDQLYREMLRVHPQLAGVPLEFAWGGHVAITFDRLPHCGRVPVDGGDVAYATGCNGTGVALATWFGYRAAAWLSGEEPPPAFAQLPFPAVPLHPLRDAYLPAVGWWLRARDRIGR